MTESFRSLIMFKVIIFMVAGIIFARFYYPVDRLVFGILIGSILLSLALSFTSVHFKGALRSWALLMSIALGGIINYTIHADQVMSPTQNTLNATYGQCILQLEDYPKKSNSIRAKVKILSVDSLILHKPIYAEVYSKNLDLLQAKPKDTLVLQSFIQRITPSDVAADFDYNQYLLDQGISYQLWSKGTILTLPIKSYKGLEIIKYQWRSAALAKLKSHLTEVNFGLAASLILGYRNQLDPEVRDQFANTGAIHILAVSGMHVGIVIFFLNFILFQKFDKRLESRTVWKGLLLSAVLLLYVFITGAALPVIRATMLFIFLYFAFFLQRDYSRLNILALMAVLLLIWNPVDLFNLSFLLSFGAVTSIIVFYPIISQSLYVPNRFLGFLWSIVAMSISAQILIFPLTILYFHQFPIYFILSSIVAILLAMIILPIGFAFLLLPFPSISRLLGPFLDQLCHSLNTSISAISHWPIALIENIRIDFFQILLAYMALISIALFLYSLKIKWINLSLLSLIVLITYGIYIVGESKNQAIIHHYQNQGVVDIIIGNKAYQLNTNKLEQNAIQRITSRFRRMHHVNEVEDITTEELCQLVE